MAKRDGGGATRISKGTTEEVPSQEGQQGPRRGWVQSAGGQGSRWQDTEPSRQRQRLQGSPGGKKCSWWRAGTASPDRGQPAGTTARECVTWHKGQEELRGEAALGALPTYQGTAGSTLPEAGLARDRTAADSDAPGTVRCRSEDG